MTQKFRTDQEAFWAGDFGDEYTARNQDPNLIVSNVVFFSRMLQRAGRIRSAIEFGANRGLNLHALRMFIPEIELAAVEINKDAVAQLKQISDVTVHHQSLLDFEPKRLHDFSFVKGVLIHINPDELRRAYEVLYLSSSRFIGIAEYYNPTPVSISYRGHGDRLFKRDFVDEMLTCYTDLRLADYGFIYHGDSLFPPEDINWFLLEKTAVVR
jgi:pseudaminic acid biosynthesis-associated methylase